MRAVVDSFWKELLEEGSTKSIYEGLVSQKSFKKLFF